MTHRPVFLPTRNIRPDETISSLLDRAGAIYGVGGAAFGQALLDKGTSSRKCAVPEVKDWDDPPAEALEILADACGTTWQYLKTLTVQDNPTWIAPGFRTAYCPSCFAIHLHGKTPPYFRREWSLASRTFCWEHKWLQPLLNWPLREPEGDAEASAPARILPAEWVTNRLLISNTDEQKKWLRAANCSLRQDIRIQEESEDIASRLKWWEYGLEASVHMAVYMPSCYFVRNGGDLKTGADEKSCRGNSDFAPDGRLARVASLGPQAGELRPSDDGWHWKPRIIASVPDGQMSVESAWDDFRRTGNPAERRAAFWLAACSEGEDLRKLCAETPVFVRMAPFQGGTADAKPLRVPAIDG